MNRDWVHGIPYSEKHFPRVVPGIEVCFSLQPCCRPGLLLVVVHCIGAGDGLGKHDLGSGLSGLIRPPHLRLVDVYFGVCLSLTSMLVGVVSWLGEGLEEGLMQSV